MRIVVDARGLAPPEPLERVMSALCEIKSGDEVVLILEQEPFPLYRVLELNGYTHRSTPFPDGRFEILIQERPKP